MSSGPGPLDRLLDVVFYAPLGLVLRAGEEVPKLASHARAKFGPQARLARMVGQMAVAQGRRQVESALGSLLAPERPTNEGTAPAPAPAGIGSPAGSGPPRPPAAGAADGPDRPDAPRARPGPSPGGSRRGGHGEGTAESGKGVPGASELPIPGYDSLSASQVVQRLPGLTADELEAVRTYEEGSRSRKTILLRVAQLRATP